MRKRQHFLFNKLFKNLRINKLYIDRASLPNKPLLGYETQDRREREREALASYGSVHKQQNNHNVIKLTCLIMDGGENEEEFKANLCI